MIGSRRRTRSSINVWPGYVDALSALLMLIIFMLLIYVVSQLYLSQTLSDRDSELARLNSRLQEISRLLGLEQEETAALENEMAAVQNRFSESLALNDTLREELEEEKARRLEQQYNAEAQALRVEDLGKAVARAESELEDEEQLTASQRAIIQQLSNQIAALQDQLGRITAALRLQEDLTAEKEAELEEVGKRLNTLLAERVNELERYQSEFFARLRDILQDNENIRIVGDRFLLPSELLFASGSASLGQEGQQELDKLAEVLLDVVDAIPEDIDWILRIDGHTDRIPINTEAFPSNWELSTARAVAVVRYLASAGVPQNRMVAAGFGEFFPVASGGSAEALRQNRPCPPEETFEEPGFPHVGNGQVGVILKRLAPELLGVIEVGNFFPFLCAVGIVVSTEPVFHEFLFPEIQGAANNAKQLVIAVPADGNGQFGGQVDMRLKRGHFLFVENNTVARAFLAGHTGFFQGFDAFWHVPMAEVLLLLVVDRGGDPAILG